MAALVPDPLAAALAHAAAGAPSLFDLLSHWGPQGGLPVALALNAVVYLLAAARVSRVGARWPRARTAAFLAGLAVLATSLMSGIDAYGRELLSIHMVQHLLLTLVAPPLLLLGAPVTLALRALPRSARRPLAAAVTSRLAWLVSRPAVAWTLFVAVLLGTHFSPFYDAAVRSEPLHGLEHLLYLASGFLFWVPLVGADPVPRPPQPAVRILYLLLVMPPMALVGVALFSAGGVRYPAYLEPAGELGLSALADQRAAGVIMWLGGSLTLAAAAVALGWIALLREERREAAREAYAGGRGRPGAGLHAVRGGHR